MHDLKNQVREYFEHNVERFDVDALPEMLHGADNTNDTRHDVDSAAPLRRGWLIAAAAAIAVLVAIGGSSLLFGAFRTSAPAAVTPTTTQAVVTTTTIEVLTAPTTVEQVTTTTLEVLTAPTTVEQVTIDVAVSVVPGLGTLTWQRVDGDESTIPTGIQADPNGGYMSYEGSKVWRSDDGVTWMVSEGTQEFAGYESVGFQDGWAMGRNGGDSQLFERDGDSWVPVQLEDASLPPISGITWRQGLRFPVESGGVTVFYGQAWGQISWEDVYGTYEIDCGQPEPCEQEPYAKWNAKNDTFHIENPENGSLLAVVSMVVDGQTISFIDTDSGETVNTITGSADFPSDAIAEQLRRDSGLTYAGGWVAVGDSALEWTSFPWESGAQVLSVPDGGFAAYEFVYDWQGNPDAPLLLANVWTSSNARDWVNQGEPPFMDSSADYTGVRQGATQLKASVIMGSDEPTRQDFGDTWVSTDGVTWTQVEAVFPPFVDEQETDFGFVVSDGRSGRFEFWVSTDGVTWFEVEGPPGSSEPSDEGAGYGGYGGSGAVGDILFGAVGNDNGPRTLWIGTFEPTP